MLFLMVTTLYLMVPIRGFSPTNSLLIRHLNSFSKHYSQVNGNEIKVFELDVIEFCMKSEEENEQTRLGTILEDNRIQPLCCWCENFGDDDDIEFLHDEECDSLAPEDVKIIRLVESYPSQRLVGGGMGPTNPHGEESEDVFLLKPKLLSPNCKIVVRPELEIFW
eukprot:CAMPEP_0117740150 /NCGR_PEP_ID=MMETSP0947-20121206/4176_1 /TAXON_ID=44440 /ORGANISM="Chattonella subsalsa, Strain CCMP2191" /LENGTH=164 /DNA_ID=CAMNT_0005556221 /DNA_START=1 /DNA_END=495 /DNA_ORIENTATION=-